ncbi:MAG: hypothetical protein B5M52_06200, partial [Helicobacteraceae bacterium 4484_230]
MLKFATVLTAITVFLLADSSLLKTGQIKSYNQNNVVVTDGSVKDDGYYQIGLDHQYTRDDEKGIVYDHVTGLEWQDTSIVKSKTRTWQGAINYCNTLALDGGNWSLPDVKELETLVNYAECCPSIDAIFENIPAVSAYWSSTTYVHDTTKAWRVRFNWGYSFPELKSGTVLVRCVRGGNPENPNFIRSEDDIVSDLVTGLAWQDDADAKNIKKNWIGAIHYCDDLTLGSYSDWRLPNQKELISIADRSRYNPAIETIFENIAPRTSRLNASSYWSSTTRIQHPDTIDAWHVSYEKSLNYYNRKETLRHVRCVRGGEVGSNTNTPPIATDNNYSTIVDMTKSGNVITDGIPDSDPDGDTFSISANTEPSNGMLTLENNGSFIYQPDLGFIGIDLFSYWITDMREAQSNEATVRITINSSSSSSVTSSSSSSESSSSSSIPGGTDFFDDFRYDTIANYGQSGVGSFTYDAINQQAL